MINKSHTISWINEIFSEYPFIPDNIGNIMTVYGSWVEFSPKSKLVNINEHVEHFWIIKKGLTKNYLTTFDGGEFVFWFHKENELASDLRALIYEEKSRLSVEAIEPVEAFAVNYKKLDQQYQDALWWQRFMRKSLEQRFFAKEYHTLLLHLYSPEERVKVFMNSHPWVFKRVQSQYIASYLGMTPVSFSRIKTRLKNI